MGIIKLSNMKKIFTIIILAATLISCHVTKIYNYKCDCKCEDKKWLSDNQIQILPDTGATKKVWLWGDSIMSSDTLPYLNSYIYIDTSGVIYLDTILNNYLK